MKYLIKGVGKLIACVAVTVGVIGGSFVGVVLLLNKFAPDTLDDMIDWLKNNKR